MGLLFQQLICHIPGHIRNIQALPFALFFFVRVCRPQGHAEICIAILIVLSRKYFIFLYKHQWNARWAFAGNLISSHVKITCYLHMWKYHLCYGYIINCAFHIKKLLKWNGLVFHWCYIIKRTLHGRLEIRNFSSRVEKIFHEWAQRTSEIFFQHSKRNFVSPRGHVVSSIFFLRNLNNSTGQAADIFTH